MTTPNWTSPAWWNRNSPPWAKWAAKDADGLVFFYGNRPELTQRDRYVFRSWNADARDFCCAKNGITIEGDWTKSIRRRPVARPKKRAKRAVRDLIVGVRWTPVDQALPPCKRSPLAPGVEVLVWPRPTGHATALYGRRASGRPAFYMYGAILDGITHWAEIPICPLPAPATKKGKS